MALARATAVSALGLVLFAAPWPAPMAGLALLCAGAFFGLGAARGWRRRAH